MLTLNSIDTLDFYKPQEEKDSGAQEKLHSKVITNLTCNIQRKDDKTPKKIFQFEWKSWAEHAVHRHTKLI